MDGEVRPKKGRPRRRIKTGTAALVALLILGCLTSTAKPASALTTMRFGVLTGNAGTGADTSRLAAQHAAGLRIRTLELAWDQAEPSNGSFAGAYFTAKAAELQAYRDAGFVVSLDLGFHYAPSWVRNLDANAKYKNQFGDEYAPGSPGKTLANGVFNNSVRIQMDQYIAHVASVLGNDFDSVRAGAGYYGELHYPEGAYNGRTNSFWGYDANAQGTANNRPTGVATNPVPGWTPNAVRNGTFENGLDASATFAGADSVVTSNPHRGTRSLNKVNPGSFSNQTTWVNVPVVPGQSYRASAWVKTTNGSAPACFQVSDNAFNELAINCSGIATWNRIDDTFTPTETTVRLALLTYDGGAATLGFDDVSIFPVSYGYEANDASARSFYDWYVASLANYQNWQIARFRAAGFSNKIYVLSPSSGIRDGVVDEADEAISYGLSETSDASVGQTISEGTDWAALSQALPADGRIVLYTTWIDGPALGNEASTDASEWSPVKYLASIATANGRSVAGENTGNNSAADMQNALSRAASLGVSDFIWFSDAQLSGGTYANLSDYSAAIADVNGASSSSQVGAVVIPSLTFTVSAHAGACNGVAQSAGASSSGTAVGLGRINSANGVGAQDLAVSTNAASGFSVYARNTGSLGVIDDIAGTNATPGAFPALGTEGFGYTTSDATLGTGTVNRFTNGGAKWAAMTTSNAEVSAETGSASSTVCIAFQAGANPTTPAGTYSTTVIYTALSTY